MGFFRRKRPDVGNVDSHAAPAKSASFSIETGPSWMPVDDWHGRLSAYQRQGRSNAEIRGIVIHLEKRGPQKTRTRAESAARARSVGIVARAEYMDPETEARALAPGASGLPKARLERERDRLLVVTSLGWVNPRSRTAYRAGLHSFAVAGTSYHQAAVKAGQFTPGTPVRLVREPSNVHDANAIAVYPETGRRPAGYVPKGQARRLAALLDAGNDLIAVTVRGSGPGSDGTRPHVLVCERALYDHLTR
ncbi:HIRAN domain-containing protein [Aeromicrobium sp.]|uniref:HIRAN domain-containing protein n=1 Tax=Aeromicrobium sp. TaxID=1871063 RepID=UPI002FCAE7D5